MSEVDQKWVNWGQKWLEFGKFGHMKVESGQKGSKQKLNLGLRPHGL